MLEGYPEPGGMPLATVSAGRGSAVGSGPTVAWIHGYTMDSRVFAEIWPAVPGFRHIGIDLPGHGRSPEWPAQARLADIAAAVADILRRERAQALVAVSMATMVAFELAINRMYPLEKLVVVAPGLVGMPPGAGTAQQYRLLTGMRRLGLPPEVISRAWLTAPTGIFAGLRTHAAAFSAMSALVAGHRWSELDAGGPGAFYREPQSVHDLPGSVRELLVLTGGRDMPEFAAVAADVAAAVPSARTAHFPEAGHLPLFEEPAAAAAVIADFLMGDPLDASVGTTGPDRRAPVDPAHHDEEEMANG